jgi:hypothetical protein
MPASESAGFDGSGVGAPVRSGSSGASGFVQRRAAHAEAPPNRLGRDRAGCPKGRPGRSPWHRRDREAVAILAGSVFIIGDQRRHPSVPVTQTGNCRYGSTARGGKRQHRAGQVVGRGSRQKGRRPIAGTASTAKRNRRPAVAGRRFRSAAVERRQPFPLPLGGCRSAAAAAEHQRASADQPQAHTRQCQVRVRSARGGQLLGRQSLSRDPGDSGGLRCTAHDPSRELTYLR